MRDQEPRESAALATKQEPGSSAAEFRFDPIVCTELVALGGRMLGFHA
jgi:hypothetical protein